jgi:hypothetical protein
MDAVSPPGRPAGRRLPPAFRRGTQTRYTGCGMKTKRLADGSNFFEIKPRDGCRHCAPAMASRPPECDANRQMAQERASVAEACCARARPLDEGRPFIRTVYTLQ